MADAETTLRQLIEKILREQKYNHSDIAIKALTSGGANYTSTLFSVIIQSPKNETLKLFAKVANVNEKIRTIMKIGTLFAIEDFVYTDLSKIYNRIQEKHGIPVEERYTFPDYFGSDLNVKQETIVLEDLVTKGYTTYSRFKAVDWEHMTEAVKSLAMFHALSFAYQKDDPDSFNRCLERVKVIPPSVDPNMKEAWAKIIGGAVQAVNEENKGRLLKFLSAETARDDYYKFKMPLETPVLCHGDYRISNIMFRRRNGRLQPIVLDFQMLHSGSLVVDLLYLEFMGTDEEFRRENHERLLNYYYEQLTLALKRLAVDVNEVYPRETFDAEFKEMLAPALRMSSVVLPFVTVEAERAPNLGGETDLQDIAISPNQLFAERFNGIVNDCIRWGVL